MHTRALLVCLAVFVTACSSSGTTVGSTVDAEHFCTTLAKIAIDKEAECFKLASAVVNDYTDHVAEHCAAVQHEVDAGRSSYDAVKGSACAHAVTALPGCSAYSAMIDPTADCNTAVRGAVPITGACWSASDCADGYCMTTTGCDGQCVAYSMEGQPCMTPCAPGLVCGRDSSGGSPFGSCGKPSDADGPCPCKPGLYCDYGSPLPDSVINATPTCKPQRRSGFCQWSEECAPGFVCAGDVRSCVPLVGLGASCGGAAQCGWGHYCDPATAACAAYPDLGQACVLSRDGSTARLMCMRGSCDELGTKKCVAPRADGEACTSSVECASYYCDSAGTKQCVARKAGGEACTSADECASYYCDSVQQRCGDSYVPPVCTPP